MATGNQPTTPAGGFQARFHPRVLGSAAPVFPGFEVDICDHLKDGEKPDAVWHRDRARQMIRAHPEIKQVFGNTPSTAVWCTLFAAGQIALALALGQQPFWIVLLTAYVVGSWININLFMLAHECNHHLVFKKSSWNRALFTLTTMPMFLSGHHTWWVEHHVHHNDLGAKKDFIKRRRSFILLTKQQVLFVIRRGPLYNLLSWLGTPLFHPYALVMLVTQAFRSVLGLTVYFFGSLLRGRLTPSDRAIAFLADEHLVSGYKKYGFERWAVVYPILSLGLTALLFVLGGWKSVIYLLLAQLFMTGFLHPVMFGMILSNSHFHGHKRYQPSASYYGWLNWITFNFGLHTEHHDIAGVAWSRLPKMRKIAPEFYDDLVKTPSYPWLALQFAFATKRGLEANFDNEVHRNLAMNSDGATQPVDESDPDAEEERKQWEAFTTGSAEL